MSNPFRKVRPGDQVRIPAEVWNASLEAARAEQQRQHGANSAALSQQRSSDIVRIRNGTGGALPRGSILGIAGPIFGPDMSEAAFLREVAFRGVTPTADHAGRFVVLLEPAADGQVVRGWAAGSCPCVVNVVDEADDRCDVDAGQTGRLVSSTTGSAQIVWKESGTGEVNAIIRFGSTCCAAPTPAGPTAPCCPSGTTVPETLFYDFSYAVDFLCSIGNGGSGGPVAVTATLNYNAAYYFPTANVTAAAWVGCVEMLYQRGDADACSTCLSTSPLFIAFTFDADVIDFYSSSSTACAVLVYWGKYCNDDPESTGPPDPGPVKNPGDCTETPGTFPLWYNSGIAVDESDITCSPFSAENVTIGIVYE